MTHRRTVPIGILTSIALIVAACGGGNTSPSPGAGSPAATTAAASASASAPASSAAASPSASAPASESPSASAPASESPSASAPASESPSASASASASAPASPSASASVGAGASFVPNPNVTGTLNVLFFGCKEGDGDEVALSRIARFQELYPNVTLNCTPGGFDAQAFQTAIGSSTPPDVVNMDGRNLGTYAANGNIMALDEMAGAANLDFGTFHPAAMAQVTLGGKVYGVPQFFDTPILIINNKVLAEANVSIDDVDTADWDKLRETATKLTVKEGNDITRLGFDPKLPEFLTLWARANGASLLSEDGKTSNLKDPKVAEALDFAASLIKDQAGDQATFQAFKDTWGFFAPENQVAENQLAFWPQEQWYLDVLSELSPDVDITVKPFNDRQGNPITQNIGGAFVIPESSANKEAGFEFARFMTSAEAWTIAAQAKKDVRAEQKRPFIGIYVANQQAMDQIFSQVWEPGDNEAYNNAVEVIRSAQANTAVTPANGAAAEFRRAYEDAVSAVLNDGTSAAEALATADEEAQGALDQAPTP